MRDHDDDGISEQRLLDRLHPDRLPRAGESKFHWWNDTKRYLLQVVRMVLIHEPIRFFGPLATVLGLVETGKLVFDLIDKGLRVATNTIVILGLALALGGIGLLADLLVQLNTRRHDVMPATVVSEQRPKG